MPRQHCTNLPDTAQKKSRANIEQEDKIVRNKQKEILRKDTPRICLLKHNDAKK